MINVQLPFDPAKLHTTDMGAERIRRNLRLTQETDPVEYCRGLIASGECRIYRQGKNFYCENGGARITVNAHSLTIITAHSAGKM